MSETSIQNSALRFELDLKISELWIREKIVDPQFNGGKVARV